MHRNLYRRYWYLAFPMAYRCLLWLSYRHVWKVQEEAGPYQVHFDLEHDHLLHCNHCVHPVPCHDCPRHMGLPIRCQSPLLGSFDSLVSSHSAQLCLPVLVLIHLQPYNYTKGKVEKIQREKDKQGRAQEFLSALR